LLADDIAETRQLIDELFAEVGIPEEDLVFVRKAAGNESSTPEKRVTN